MDEKQWKEAIKRTGMKKAQINKYLWDIQDKCLAKDAEMKRDRGILFEVFNTKSGKYRTPARLVKSTKSSI